MDRLVSGAVKVIVTRGKSFRKEGPQMVASETGIDIPTLEP